jgi:hypothetical protein
VTVTIIFIRGWMAQITRIRGRAAVQGIDRRRLYGKLSVPAPANSGLSAHLMQRQMKPCFIRA